MKTTLSLIALLACVPVFAASTPTMSWIPAGLPPAPATGPALTPGNFLKPEQGKAVLDAALERFPDRASWEAYAQHVRDRIQQGAGLAPWPKRTPLNPVVRKLRTYDGYTVENVTFESVPGYLVTGNLYKPTKTSASMPAILATHGHSAAIAKPEDYEKHARFSASMQARCASLAQMGAVVFSIDMFAYGDSIQLVGQAAHRQPFAFSIQLWNAMRAVDFLTSLDGVDAKRIAVTGESGGGTQAFMLTALDPRIAVSAPVVMVSSYFFGGCPCESGQPVHRSADHFASNAMIASLAAPRPMIVVSDGKDWTQHVPEIEFPFIKKIYGYYGAPQAVANVHLPEEGHDYGPSKRVAVYRYLADKLGLDLKAIQKPDGTIDEARVTIEKPALMHVFDSEYPIPHNALHDLAAIEQQVRALQK